jgi:hypothetical protein
VPLYSQHKAHAAERKTDRDEVFVMMQRNGRVRYVGKVDLDNKNTQGKLVANSDAV